MITPYPVDAGFFVMDVPEGILDHNGDSDVALEKKEEDLLGQRRQNLKRENLAYEQEEHIH